MKARPVLFSAPMIRSLLADQKTKTRRIAKRPPYDLDGFVFTHLYDQPNGVLQASFTARAPVEGGVKFVSFPCPYGQPGDALWVKENYRLDVAYDRIRPSAAPTGAAVWFEAGGSGLGDGVPGRLRPSIHMRRADSRLSLVVTDVRVERLHAIDEAEAAAEGITCENVIVGANCYGGHHHEETADRYFFDGCPDDGYETGADAYLGLWAVINGQASADADPWVWVVAFTVHRQNIDALISARAAP